jgi:lysophospholipase L1-like esterase
MRHSLCCLGLLVLTLPAVSRAATLLQSGDTVAICGDSITEQKKYAVMMEDYFLMCQPAPQIRTFNFGWGGEIALTFAKRLENDVLWYKPTVATTSYGMNDGHYADMSTKTGDDYRQGLLNSIEKLRNGGVRVIVVGSPGPVDGASFKSFTGIKADGYNKTLKALRDIAEDTARKENLPFADVYTPMMDVMTKSKAAYGQDYLFIKGGGIHPEDNGHIVMAYAYLKALGCDGAIGTITVDMMSDRAQGTDGQQILSCREGEVTVESSRYPFCFTGDPDGPSQNDASVLKFFPFNDDLNRYLLVVKNLNGTKAKVTWGSTSKEFSAADLAKGINLAAEFIDNPFSKQFAEVDTAVHKQQDVEIDLVKKLIHSQVPGVELFPPGSKPMEPSELRDKITEQKQKEEDLFRAAVAAVRPVQHTIQIESEP